MADAPRTSAPLRDLAPFVGVLVAVIGVLLAVSFVHVRVSSGLRAYVNGESLWTKAQKRAVLHLWQYSTTGDTAEFREYREALATPLADRRGRLALVGTEPDYPAAREAFVEAGHPAEDVDEQIFLVRWFGGLAEVRDAMELWARADSLVLELQEVAGRLRRTVESRGPSSPAVGALMAHVQAVDRQLGEVEGRFSTVLAALHRREVAIFQAALGVLGVVLLGLGTWVVWTLLGRLRATEARVREREERFRTLVRATRDVVWEWDLDSDRVSRHRAFHDDLGSGPEAEEMERAAWAGRVHPEDRDRVEESLDELLSSERDSVSSEYRFRKADGSYTRVYDRAYLLRDAEGRPNRVIGSFIDLEEHRELQEALERTRERYLELLEQASDAIFVAGPEWHLEVVNDTACELLGYEREELVGQRIQDLLHPVDLERDPIDVRALDEGESVLTERRMRRADGDWLVLELSARRLSDGGYQAIGRDVSARRKLATRLRQAQRLEAVGRLAGGVAHDFNNLLTAITGNAQLLLSELDEDDPRREDVLEIERTAGRAAELVSQLLAFSRKRAVEARVVDVGEVVTEMERMLRRILEPRVRLELRRPSRPCPTKIDPGQLEQVVVNLAVNARDAMPSGGVVRIEVSRGPWSGEPPLGGGLHPDPGWVRIRVSDSGRGMDASTRERIFEPFFTRKEDGEGTGLGLATVYGIVRQAGGDVEVESEPGVGSVFDVLLPLAGG